MKTKDKVISHLLSLIKKLTTALTDKKVKSTQIQINKSPKASNADLQPQKANTKMFKTNLHTTKSNTITNTEVNNIWLKEQLEKVRKMIYHKQINNYKDDIYKSRSKETSSLTKNGQNTSSRRLNDFWNKWKKDNAEKQR